MKGKTIVYLLCITGLFGTVLKTTAQEKPVFDRSLFYKAMASEKSAEVDAELNLLNHTEIPDKDAYLGALTMKKAGLGGTPPKKLSLFKAGHKKLESAIKMNADNPELRFLRLMIQENAPGILGYKGEIKSDSDYIRKSYKDLPEDLQASIKDYSKKSKTLKPADF
jgi:hypothetical protein